MAEGERGGRTFTIYQGEIGEMLGDRGKRQRTQKLSSKWKHWSFTYAGGEGMQLTKSVNSFANNLGSLFNQLKIN